MKKKPTLIFLIFLYLFLINNVFSQKEEKVIRKLPINGKQMTIKSFVQKKEGNKLIAENSVEINYDGYTFKGDFISYNIKTNEIEGKGNISFSKGKMLFKCSHFSFNLENKTGIFYEVSGNTDKFLYIKAKKIKKIDKKTYKVYKGMVSTCPKCTKGIPYWSLNSSKIKIVKNSSVTGKNFMLKLFDIPIFYLPWMKLPILKRERKSGFLIPSTGGSNLKGRKISDTFYLPLGRSSDLFLTGDYFSKRGWGIGTHFRSLFSDISYIDFRSYSVYDRLNEGGSEINISSFFHFGRGFKAIVKANLVTNINFRRIYSDNFVNAIRPDENLLMYLEKSGNYYFFSSYVERNQLYLPDTTIILRKNPSFNFDLIGLPILKNSMYIFAQSSLSLDFKSVNNWTGSNESFRTPNSTNRLDLDLSVSYPLKLSNLFTITFTPKVRNTFYSKYKEDNTAIDGSLTRKYGEFDIDIMGPKFYRKYKNFTHVIETFANYRFISDIDNIDKIIIFDPIDAILGTNEINYGFTNRFFKTRENGSPYEWLSISIYQRYYFEPDFNHEIKNNEANIYSDFLDFSPFPFIYGPKRFSPIGIYSKFYPTQYFSADFTMDYDTKRGGANDFAFGGTFAKEVFFCSASFLRIKNPIKDSKTETYLQNSIGLGNSNNGLSMDMNISYNLEESNIDNYYLKFNYFKKCIGFSVEYINFDIYKRRSENELRFSLYLKGFATIGKLRNYGRKYF